MSQVNTVQSNFVGGQLSQNMSGRYELPLYATGLEIAENFVIEATGPIRFRNGTQFVNPTRRDKKAVFIPFQFSDSQAYELEFTDGYIRFYTNNGILTNPSKTITGATAANPCVITSVAHGYATGDEVLISGIKGMTQLNNRSFVITVLTADTFSLQDNFAANINSSAYTAYVSGGIAEKVYEITSPYAEADLYALKYAQNADTLRIVHRYYEPRDLVRSGSLSWALSLFTRTADPFLSKKAITAITLANPGVITSAGHGYTGGETVIIEGIVGTTQLNSRQYTIVYIGVNTFSLKDLNGNAVDTSAYTAWSSGGYVSLRSLLPGAVTFFQGRCLYGYSDTYTQSFWGSRALDTSGNPRYNDMTTGTNADDGFKFTLASTSGKIDKIQDLTPTSKFLAIGTFGGVSAADGGSTGAAITPSNISVNPAVSEGMVQTSRPISLGTSLLYIHRSGLTLYSLEYDVFYNAFNAIDKNLTNEDLTQSGILQMVLQRARPQSLYFIRNDGVFLGATFLPKESINGWYKFKIGGASVKVLSAGAMPRSSLYDQVWVIVERVINGQTRRYVEYFNDQPVFPQRDAYYSADSAVAADDARFRLAMFEKQKEYIHLDSTLTYDGSAYGTDAGATLTPGATTGTSVTFTAGAAVFDATMVGRELWKRSIDGIGTGRAKIVGYTSTTVVTCQILEDFDVTTVMAAGNWFLTTATVTGAWHLEGRSVSIVTDGGVHDNVTVASGSVTIQYQASVIHLGEGYIGLAKSMNVEAGGVNGPAVSKPKNMNQIGLRFINSLGVRYGTDLYHMEELDFRAPTDNANRPPPLFSNCKRVSYEDTTDNDKHIYIQQIRPLPCTVIAVVPYMDCDNE